MAEMNYVNRKLMFVGLFLSKYGKDALSELGFSTWPEAYNSLAFTIGGKPNSLKLFRQEFDPYFPNGRKGWTGRKIRPTRLAMLEEFGNFEFVELAQMVKTQLVSNSDIDTAVGKATAAAGLWSADDTPFAKRIMTGQAAENFFETHYASIERFSPCQVTRTTAFGCGFDFKLTPPSGEFLAVEVKGLRTASGQIQLTEKEYKMAGYLQDRFYLYVVADFAHTPVATVIENPLESGMSFEAKTLTSEQKLWVTQWAA